MSNGTNGSAAPRIMAAFATGALVGAGVAILFAPQSGKQTRDMVASKTHELKDEACDVIDRGRHFVNEVKHKAHEAFENGKEVAHEMSDDVKHKAREAFENGKEVAHEMSDEVKHKARNVYEKGKQVAHETSAV